MKLKRITMESFRGFDKCEINFNGKSAVIFGDNGAGKTTVLRAINLIFSNILDEVLKTRTNSKNKILLDGMDVKINSDFCHITADIEAFNETYNYRRSYIRSMNKRTHDLNAVKPLVEKLIIKDSEIETLIESLTHNLPIFVNYGVHRIVAEVNIAINNNISLDQMSAYKNAILNKIDFASFFEWFRHREDIENEFKSYDGLDYEDIQLKTVKKAVSTFLEDISDIKVFREENAFKVNKNNVWYNILQLSDGEKCIIALLGDLARRLAMANPGLENPLDGEGVVLIDEIDLHLHPKWQRKIFSVLRTAFPNVQFIATTHSPLILSELDDETLVFSTSNENSESITVDQIKPVNGWNVESILTQFMDAKSLKDDTQKLISDAYDNIDDKKFDEAEKLIDRLEEKTNSTNSAVVDLRYLLSRRSVSALS